MTNETSETQQVIALTPLRTALLAACSAGAAAAHFAMAPAHAEESALLATGFAVVAWAQVAFAIGVLVRPRHWLLLAGALLNVGAIAVWGWSRLFGLPIGSGEVEAIATLDALTIAFEAVVVVAASWWPLTRSAPRTTRALQRSAFAAGVLAAVVIVGTTGVLASPTVSAHDHGHHDEAAATHTHAATEADHHEHEATGSGTDATASTDTAAEGGHQHPVCTDPVTPKQQVAADTLVAETRSTIARWSDFNAALADGFRNITPEGQLVVHYAKPEFATDGVNLDPARPETLLYAFPKRQSAPVLLGAMYLHEGAGEPAAPGGCLTLWHNHTNLCIAPGEGMVAVVGADGSCPPGSSNETTTSMMHVWLYDTSAGPFADLSQIDPTELRNAVIAARTAG